MLQTGQPIARNAASPPAYPRAEVRRPTSPVSAAKATEPLCGGRATATARGRVVSHDRLLAAGWPGDPDPDPQWLKPHLARLRAKLEDAGAPLPTSVRGVGYRLEAPGEASG